jgi:hypothetical protein
MYKNPTKVMNNILGGNDIVIWEGKGGHALYNVVIKGPKTPLPQEEMYLHTTFDNNDDDQIYQGWCGSIQVAEDLDIDNVNDYKNLFAELFERAYVKQNFVLYDANAETEGHRPFGIRLKYMEDEKLCGLHFALNTVPNAAESNNCVDLDGDGFTNCVNDCNDNDANIHPQREDQIEGGCSDGIDNNCNGLIDCDEWSCAWKGNSNDGLPNQQCRSSQLPSGFCGDGVIQTVNSYGLDEECDVKIEEKPYEGVNNCASRVCLPPGVPGIEGCTCA